MAVDLRWGVSDEAGLDQQTMAICLEELRRCKESSPRPYLLVLLGQRYGWRPLPVRIPAVDFEALQEHIPDEEKPLLVADRPRNVWRAGHSAERIGWYCKDCNAVPNEYVLQSRLIEVPTAASAEERKAIRLAERQDWARIEAKLRQLFSGAIARTGWKPDDPRRTLHEFSATHQELLLAISSGKTSAGQIFCYFRTIDPLPKDGTADLFCDLDDSSGVQLAKLKATFGERLPPGRIHNYRALWKDGAPRVNLKKLCRHIYRELKRTICKEFKAFRRVSDLRREERAHRKFALERANQYLGGESLPGEICCYVNGTGSSPLVVTGPPGSGKTTCMAKGWSRIRSSNTPGTILLARFLGVTPASIDLRSLLGSLCARLGKELGLDRPIPGEMTDLIRMFSDFLQSVPTTRRLVLFLDGLEQLGEADNARSLRWLPCILPKNVKLILSIGGPLQGYQNPIDDIFETARALLPKSCFFELGPLSPEDRSTIISARLASIGRILQADQHAHVLQRLSNCPIPLYLELAYQTVRRWKSYDGLPPNATSRGLGGSVMAVLGDMLDRLSADSAHGSVLVSKSLAFLGAARHGLSENELLDLLSADAEVMEDFRKRSPESPSVDRLPAVIWSRLHHEIDAHLASRTADRSRLLAFADRHLAQMIAQDFLRPKRREAVHKALAIYFGKQPYVFSDDSVNVRKISELPYQFARAGARTDLEKTLSDTKFVQAARSAGLLYQMISDLDMAEKMLAPVATDYDRFLAEMVLSQNGMNDDDALRMLVSKKPGHLQAHRMHELRLRLQGELRSSATPTPSTSTRILCLRWALDGKSFLAGAQNGTLLHGLLDDDRIVRIDTGSQPVCDVAMNKAATACVLGSKTVRVLHPLTFEKLGEYSTDSAVTRVDLSPDGRHVVATGQAELYLWGAGLVPTRIALTSPPVEPGPLTSVQGVTVVQQDGTVRSWNWQGSAIGVPNHTAAGFDRAHLRDVGMPVLGIKRIRLFGFNFASRATWTAQTDTAIRIVGQLADGWRCATITTDGRVALWDLEKGHLLEETGRLGLAVCGGEIHPETGLACLLCADRIVVLDLFTGRITRVCRQREMDRSI